MVTEIKPKDRILVALDVSSVNEALALVGLLEPRVGGFKIGLELTMSIISGLLGQVLEKDVLV